MITSCGGEGEVEGGVRVHQRGWGGGHGLGSDEVWGQGAWKMPGREEFSRWKV